MIAETNIIHCYTTNCCNKFHNNEHAWRDEIVSQINTRFRDNRFLENNNGTLERGDFYEDRVVVTKVSGFVILLRETSFKAFRKSFIRKFRRQFSS